MMFWRTRADLRPLNADEQTVESNLRKHVDVLAGLIGPRFALKPHTLEAAEAYVTRTLQEIGVVVNRLAYPCGKDEVANLEVRFEGTSTLPAVVVGAHYDTVPTTPGADDNASAVATLLEIVRHLKGQPERRRSVRCVFFPNEEPPYFNFGMMGSQQYARDCRKRNDELMGMICLEMVGYFTEERVQTYPDSLPKWLTWGLPKKGNFATLIADFGAIGFLYRFARAFRKSGRFPDLVFSLPQKVPEIILSDHRGFREQNYPALMVTDTSFLRNPNYHLASDKPETLNYQQMARLTMQLSRAVQRLSR